MCQKSTAHEQRRSRGESRKLRFGSNLTAPINWQEGHNMIFTVHLNGFIDENTPLEHSTIETCLQEAYKYQKLRKFPVTSGHGSKHRGDWTASRWWARWRSQSSSCQEHVITWRGLIPADHECLDSVAWPCHDCEVAPVWHHDVTNAARASFSAVCLTVFPFEFRPRTFTIGFYGKSYHIRAYDFGVQFSFNTCHKRLSSVSITEDWALFVWRTFIFLSSHTYDLGPPKELGISGPNSKVVSFARFSSKISIFLALSVRVVLMKSAEDEGISSIATVKF